MTQPLWDIWHQVPLVPQLTGMSCWAAAAAMLIGWRECIHARPEQIAKGAGYWAAYREGLDPHSIDSLATNWQLQPVYDSSLSPQQLKTLLTLHGPLWIGEASPGLHSVVITGMYGDGTDNGTFVRINDPWPLQRGERYSKTVAALQKDIAAARQSVGNHIQILHCAHSRRASTATKLLNRQRLNARYKVSARYQGRINVSNIHQPIADNYFIFKHHLPMVYRWSNINMPLEKLDIVVAETLTSQHCAYYENGQLLIHNNYSANFSTHFTQPTLMVTLPQQYISSNNHLHYIAYQARSWFLRNYLNTSPNAYSVTLMKYPG